MKNNGFIKLIFKVLLVLTPLLIQILVYAIFDPFEVLYHYDRHYSDNNVVYNRDYISTEIFLANYKKENYDSFIFGNSRSLAFQCRDWDNYIKAKGVFHFDASAESLYGIYKKIMFLDRKGVALRNCLLILDDITIAKCDNHEGHLFIKHPEVSQESATAFQMEFFRVFMKPRFLIGYLDYKIHNRIRPAFNDLFMPSEVRYDPITNDIFIVSQEEEIQRAGSKYYEKKRNIFFIRDQKGKNYTTQCIKDVQKKYFEEIKMIFEKNKTNYLIIISPVYDQKYLNMTDLHYLENLFGKKNVLDFSGVNEYTNSIYNYYETIHYRPVVGRQILKNYYLNKK